MSLLHAPAPFTSSPRFVKGSNRGSPFSGQRVAPVARPGTLLDHATGDHGALVRSLYLRAVGQLQLAANLVADFVEEGDDEWTALHDRLRPSFDSASVSKCKSLVEASLLFQRAELQRAQVEPTASDRWRELSGLDLPTVDSGMLRLYAALNSAIHGDTFGARGLLEDVGLAASAMPELVVANAWIAVREQQPNAGDSASDALRAAYQTDDVMLREEAAALVAVAGIDPEMRMLSGGSSSDAVDRWHRVLGSFHT